MTKNIRKTAVYGCQLKRKVMGDDCVDCNTCGWNPAVDRRRKAEFKEQSQQQSEENTRRACLLRSREDDRCSACGKRCYDVSSLFCEGMHKAYQAGFLSGKKFRREAKEDGT